MSPAASWLLILSILCFSAVIVQVFIARDKANEESDLEDLQSFLETDRDN